MFYKLRNPHGTSTFKTEALRLVSNVIDSIGTESILSMYTQLRSINTQCQSLLPNVSGSGFSGVRPCDVMVKRMTPTEGTKQKVGGHVSPGTAQALLARPVPPWPCGVV